MDTANAYILLANRITIVIFRSNYDVNSLNIHIDTLKKEKREENKQSWNIKKQAYQLKKPREGRSKFKKKRLSPRNF